jgi:hypothetical protein
MAKVGGFGKCVVSAVLVLVASSAAVAQTGYFGIPDGFDYPADKTRLEGFRKDQNLPALRLHSWMLFAGLTQMTPDGTPYWETWYRVTEAFRPAGPTPQGPRRIIREFETPTQLKAQGLEPHAPGQSILSDVLFNQETYDHIRTNGLYQLSKLQSIDSSFPASSRWDQRKITDFPARAMSLKSIWWPAAADHITPLPIWDNDPANSASQGNPWQTWKRVVAVDATRPQVPARETMTISFDGISRPGTHVVGRNQFYVVPVTVEIIDTINRAIQAGDTGLKIDVQGALGRDLQVGDYLLFLGFHITSKEVDDWTWSTLWWHDRPNDGPFAAGRPDEVKGVWRNYLMTNADDQLTPREPDGSPRIGFNPWLEARFQNGILSNCMTCHHRASLPQTPQTRFLPVKRGLPDPNGDPAFRSGRLQTDFMWTIVDRAN